jgi:hypothetical protein
MGAPTRCDVAEVVAGAELRLAAAGEAVAITHGG